MKQKQFSPKREFFSRAVVIFIVVLVIDLTLYSFIRYLTIERPPPDASEVTLHCVSKISGLDIIGPSELLKCSIMSDVPLLKEDLSPMYAYSSDYKITNPPTFDDLTGTDGSVFFTFDLEAPNATGKFNIYIQLYSGELIAKPSVINVYEVSPSQISLTCYSPHHEPDLKKMFMVTPMNSLVDCLITGQEPFPISVFTKESISFFHLKQEDNSINKVEVVKEIHKVSDKSYLFTVKPGCFTESFAIGLKIMFSGNLTSIEQGPFTIIMERITESKANLNCLGSVNNKAGDKIGLREMIDCEIKTEIPALLSDFQNPPLVANEEIKLTQQLALTTTEQNNGNKCGNLFSFKFKAPSKKMKLELRGLLSGGIFFDESASENSLNIDYVKPRPFQVSVSCSGEVTNKKIINFDETLICFLTSDIDTFNSSFSSVPLKVLQSDNKEVIVECKIEDEEQKSMKLPGTIRRGIIVPKNTFKVTVNTKNLFPGSFKIYGILDSNEITTSNDVISVVKCPLEGTTKCGFSWQFTNDPNNIKLKKLNSFLDNVLDPTNKYKFVFWSDQQLNETKELDLTNTNTDQGIDIKGFKKLEELELSSNNFTSLYKDKNKTQFIANATLKSINLSTNKLTKIRKDNLEELINLTSLNLSKNELIELDYKVFDDNTKLNTLNLSNNPTLKSLPWGLFDKLTELKTLNIKGLALECSAKWLTDFIDTNKTKISIEYDEVTACKCPKDVEECTDWKVSTKNSVTLDKYDLKLKEGDIKTYKYLSNDSLFNLDLVNFEIATNSFEILEFSKSKLEFIPGAALKGINGIIGLEAENTNLLKLYGDFLSFDTNKQLQYISLQNNKIDLISTNTFKGSNLKYLLLNNNNIDQIDTGYFENMNELILLNLSSNKTLSIKNNSLTGVLPKLQNFLYSDCNISSINKDWFSSSKALAALDLSNNTIVTIPNNFLVTGYSQLKYVLLNNNKIQTIPTNYFIAERFPALTTLSLASNEITTLPTKAFDVSTMNKLILNTNKITSITNNIFKRNAILELDLCKNQIVNIDTDSFSTLKKIDSLYLCNNKIATLNGSIKNLSTLKVLYMPYNELTTLQNQLTSLTTLQNVNLNYNKLTNIQSGSIISDNIQKLFLEGNELTEIPTDIKTKNRALELLNLAHNKIENTLNVSSFPVLEVLYLQNNKITTLNLIDLQRLNKLDVSSNNISNLNNVQVSFGNANIKSFLSKITISKNKITQLTNSDLSSLVNLKEIDVSNNLITTIDKDFLKANYETLEELNISSNELTSIQPDFFDNFKKLKRLNIANNKFTCIEKWMKGLIERLGVSNYSGPGNEICLYKQLRTSSINKPLCIETIKTSDEKEEDINVNDCNKTGDNKQQEFFFDFENSFIKQHDKCLRMKDPLLNTTKELVFGKCDGDSKLWKIDDANMIKGPTVTEQHVDKIHCVKAQGLFFNGEINSDLKSVKIVLAECDVADQEQKWIYTCPKSYIDCPIEKASL
eukprot:GAHX01001339.1.p1 GENE.GAHX01001339.1~~GAHX01001339.1.p1  ORF type:complete len:1489 (-),score=354.79 GAHX01001339.1:30-4496(-)